MKVPDAWQSSKGAGVTVAIIDTGLADPVGDRGTQGWLFPASLPGVVGVEAEGRSGALLPASNRRPGPASRAPGEDIRVLVEDQNGRLRPKLVSGTSVATALISGLAALYLSSAKDHRGPSTPASFESALLASYGAAPFPNAKLLVGAVH